MNYSDLQNALAGLLVTSASDTKFLAMLPRAIDDAEGRIYKAMDFLAMTLPDTSKSFTPGSRDVAVPDLMVIVEKVAYFDVSTGKTNPLRDVSTEFIDAFWPIRAQATQNPSYFARKSDRIIMIGGTPQNANQVEFVGKQRPEPISSGNPSTYISLNHPELLTAACMVFLSGYQRDFGAQSDDPRMALSWETVYQDRLQASMAEEKRRKGNSERTA